MILRKPPEQSKWVERERPKHKTADFDNNSKSAVYGLFICPLNRFLDCGEWGQRCYGEWQSISEGGEIYGTHHAMDCKNHLHH